jgi:hypothetical protein
MNSKRLFISAMLVFLAVLSVLLIPAATVFAGGEEEKDFGFEDRIFLDDDDVFFFPRRFFFDDDPFFVPRRVPRFFFDDDPFFPRRFFFERDFERDD